MCLLRLIFYQMCLQSSRVCFYILKSCSFILKLSVCFFLCMSEICQQTLFLMKSCCLHCSILHLRLPPPCCVCVLPKFVFISGLSCVHMCHSPKKKFVSSNLSVYILTQATSSLQEIILYKFIRRNVSPLTNYGFFRDFR